MNHKYEHFEALCHVPSRQQQFGDKIPFVVNKCPVYERFRQTGLSDTEFVDSLADMREVRATNKNVALSLDKCDTQAVYPDDNLQMYVENIVSRYLKPILSVTVATPDHEFDVKNSTSPNSFWKELGCANKGEALQHPNLPGMVDSIYHPPICDYNMKQELLTLDDIMERGKMRGTFNPPLDFLMKEKILYDLQNEALVKHCDTSWIKYGFVKQYGGFNKLGEEYHEYEIMDEDDVTGFDRGIYLEPTMRIRNSFLIGRQFFFGMMCYVTYFIIYALVRCPAWRYSSA